MPRTKVSKNTSKLKTNEEGIDKKAILKIFLENKSVIEGEIKRLKEFTMAHLEQQSMNEFKKYGFRILNMKLGELKRLSNDELCKGINETSTASTISKNALLNQTKSIRKEKRSNSASAAAPTTRTSSLDEGYRTYDSSNSVTRTSSTRSRSRQPKPQHKNIPKKATRSLSRNAAKDFSTPLNKRTPEEFGLVTPKCKPNTPQILLRRPKQGEVALSFQGSPLLVNAIADDKNANINIPLSDGTLLSLQPQEGLRLSLIPKFDDDTLRQLETLNKHINMVIQKNKF